MCIRTPSREAGLQGPGPWPAPSWRRLFWRAGHDRQPEAQGPHREVGPKEELSNLRSDGQWTRYHGQS